jgi:hypothetical protein
VIPKQFNVNIGSPKHPLECHTVDGRTIALQVSLQLVVNKSRTLINQSEFIEKHIIQSTTAILRAQANRYTQSYIASNRNQFRSQIHKLLHPQLEKKGLKLTDIFLVNLARTKADAETPSEQNLDILVKQKQIEETYKKQKQDLELHQHNNLLQIKLRYEQERQRLQQSFELQKNEFQQKLLTLAQEQDIQRIKKMKQEFPELDVNKYLMEIRRNKLILDKMTESKVKDLKINVKI